MRRRAADAELGARRRPLRAPESDPKGAARHRLLARALMVRPLPRLPQLSTSSLASQPPCGSHCLITPFALTQVPRGRREAAAADSGSLRASSPRAERPNQPWLRQRRRPCRHPAYVRGLPRPCTAGAATGRSSSKPDTHCPHTEELNTTTTLSTRHPGVHSIRRTQPTS